MAFDNRTTIVNDPALAAAVLMQDREYAVLSTFLNRRLTPDEAVQRNAARRHLNAGLRHGAVEGLARETAQATRAAFGVAVERHRSRGARAGLDPLPVLEDVISGVVARHFFGPRSGPEVARAVKQLLDRLSRAFGSPLALPMPFPTPTNVRIRRAYQDVRAIVRPLVAQRATDPSVGDYAAGVTRSARQAGHDLERIGDLLIGSLLAAQRVPAASASWTMYELGRSPEWADLARDDTRARRAVIIESGRLHPPTWMLRRVATTEVTLGGYRFPRGHNFLVSPYVVHRDPTVFASPEAFRPARWLDGDIDHRRLLTFGKGLHRCPGLDASTVILDAAVATLLERYTIRDVSREVRAQPRTTLVPEGLELSFHDRPVAVDAVRRSTQPT